MFLVCQIKCKMTVSCMDAFSRPHTRRMRTARKGCGQKMHIIGTRGELPIFDCINAGGRRGNSELQKSLLVAPARHEVEQGVRWSTLLPHDGEENPTISDPRQREAVGVVPAGSASGEGGRLQRIQWPSPSPTGSTGHEPRAWRRRGFRRRLAGGRCGGSRISPDLIGCGGWSAWSHRDDEPGRRRAGPRGRWRL